MSERVLKSRKRKKASKGRVIRISDKIYDMLDNKRLDKRNNKRTLSWDQLFRRILNVPERSGKIEKLIEGYLEVTTGQFFLTRIEAYERAIIEAAKRKTKKVNQPIKMREIA